MRKDSTLHILYSAHGLFMLASIMITPLFALFAEKITSSILVVGYLGSALFIAKTVGTILMRQYGDVLQHKKVILIAGYILKSIGWFGLIYTGNIVTIFIMQCILGFSDGIQSPAFRALMSRNLYVGHEVSAYATWEIILAVTGIIGTTAGGFIVQWYGFNCLFFIIGTLSLISALLVGFHTVRE